MKQLELTPNAAGGLDLITERDAGNPVRILTGKRSLEFFKELKELCETAIEKLQDNEVFDDSEERRDFGNDHDE
jgi:hypothetical protein